MISPTCLTVESAFVAQLVAQETLSFLVGGSSPPEAFVFVFVFDGNNDQIKEIK